VAFKNQFTENEWLILQASPIWVFEIVAGADGRIDLEEIIEITNQIKNVAEYSSRFTYEIFKDHVTNIMNNSPEFKNIASKKPIGRFKNSSRSVRENRTFRSPKFQENTIKNSDKNCRFFWRNC